jgi:YHS domain-containing protein
MRNIVFVTVFALFAACSGTAQKAEVFSVDGKAIRGYDPVAFFTASKPVKGMDSLSYMYKEVNWLFSSRANLEAFKANPDQYMPQYGGYCAYGTADGHKAPTQPETWTIVNDKLYFNYSMKVKQLWDKNQAVLIEKADQQWPAVKQQK